MKVRELSDADIRDIVTWRYEGRYETYDVTGGVSPGLGFFAVEHGGRLVGYCCFGPEARVPGVGERPGTLDVGYGMRPELMGQGLGRALRRRGAIIETRVLARSALSSSTRMMSATCTWSWSGCQQSKSVTMATVT